MFHSCSIFGTRIFLATNISNNMWQILFLSFLCMHSTDMQTRMTWFLRQLALLFVWRESNANTLRVRCWPHEMMIPSLTSIDYIPCFSPTAWYHRSLTSHSSSFHSRSTDSHDSLSLSFYVCVCDAHWMRLLSCFPYSVAFSVPQAVSGILIRLKTEDSTCSCLLNPLHLWCLSVSLCQDSLFPPLISLFRG